MLTLFALSQLDDAFGGPEVKKSVLSDHRPVSLQFPLELLEAPGF